MLVVINPPNAGPMHIRPPGLVITVSADGLAPSGARPSADTVLIKILDMFPTKSFWLKDFC